MRRLNSTTWYSGTQIKHTAGLASGALAACKTLDHNQAMYAGQGIGMAQIIHSNVLISTRLKEYNPREE
jgi:hypothetical protein